jgi:hypothetical protein
MTWSRFIAGTAQAGLLMTAVLAAPGHATVCTGGSGQAILSLTVDGTSRCALVPALQGWPLLEVSVQAQILPAAGVRFSLPDPPIGTVLAEDFHYPFTGDRVTGVVVDLGSCASAGTLTLATLTVLLPDTVAACVGWQVDSGCEVVDRQGVTRPAYATHHAIGRDASTCSLCDAYWQECFVLPPYDTFPACGAADVPLDVQLSWTTPALAPKWLRIGTDPTFVTWQTFHLDGNSFSPDFLERGTTYYWRVDLDLTGEVCDGGTSPIESFTTRGTTAVERRDWSAVKVLYRSASPIKRGR